MKTLRSVLMVVLVLSMMFSLSSCGTRAELELKGSNSSTNCTWDYEILEGGDTIIQNTDVANRKSGTLFTFKGLTEGNAQVKYLYTHKYYGYSPKMYIYDYEVLKGNDVYYIVNSGFEYAGSVASAVFRGGEDDDYAWTCTIGDENVITLKSQDFKRADTNYTLEIIEDLENMTKLPYATNFAFNAVAAGETTLTFTCSGSKTETVVWNVVVDEDLSISIT